MKSMVEIFVAWVLLESLMSTVVGLVIHLKSPWVPSKDDLFLE